MKLAHYLTQLARHGIVYGTADFLGKVLGFALIPLYTRALDPVEFGQLQALLTLQTFALMTLSLGQLGTLLRYYTRAEGAERKQVVSGIGSMIGASTAVFLVVLVLSGPLLARAILHDPGKAPLFQILALGIGARMISDIAMTILRLQEKSGRYALYNFLRLLSSLVLILYFVLVRDMGLTGAVLGESLSSLGLFLAQAPMLLKSWGRLPTRSVLREYLVFGLPFLFANLGAVTLQSVDKLLLASYGMLAATGVYSLAVKLSSLISVVLLAPFTLVWGPMMYRVHRDHTREEAQRFFSRMLTYFAVLLYFVGIGIVLFAREVIEVWATPEYAGAKNLVPLLVASAILYGFYRHLQVGLNLTGRTQILAWSFLLAAVANVIGNALLIPRWGAMGAAIATFASYVLMVVLVARAAYRAYPIRYEWGRLAASGALAVALCLLLPWFERLDLVPRIAGKSLALIAYPLLLGASKFLRPGERAFLLERWRAWRGRLSSGGA
jgi:O-antigen/teichoic acid export membrane protein